MKLKELERELKVQGLEEPSFGYTQIVHWSRERAAVGVIKLLVMLSTNIVTALVTVYVCRLWNETWMLLSN